MKKIHTNIFVSRRFSILFIFACAAGITLGSFFWAGSKAQDSSAETPTEKSQAQPADLQEEFSRLIGIAQVKGSVRVIVGLKVAFKAIGELSKRDQSRQKTNIKQAQEDLLVRLKSYDLKEVKQFEFIPFMAAEVDAPALKKMRDDPQIISIQEDEAVAPTLAESVPLVGAPAAWTAGFSGSGWAVAVLDSGVDKNHSFLSGKVISEACYSSNFTGTASSVCPGAVTQSTATNSGLNCNTAIDGCAHGTHVAGIAAGRGTSFSGVAKDANLIAIQVFSRFDNQSDCGTAVAPCARTYTSDQILGLERVLNLSSSTNIAAVNMSLGGGQYFSNCDAEQSSRKTAIDNLRSVGIATVISSGNDGFTGSMGAPGCISSAISVGAIGDGSGGWTTNVVTSYSNSASFLNLLAPGSLITSSVPGGGYANYNGTSMAAPHVTGAWAVMKQKKPTATVTEILNAFTSTGQSITDSRNGIVKPRIKVDAALAAISANCGSASISVGQTLSGNLQSGDCLYSDNSFYDAYTFSGTAGQQVYITLNSTQFNAYLLLYQGSYPGGSLINQDNDGGGGTNARIPASGFVTLPATGTYTILANSLSAGESGSYTLFLGTNTPVTFRRPFDFDGDGKTDISIFRPSNGQWWINRSSNNSTFAATFGVSTDKIVPADYTGDGKTDIAIWRPTTGEWFILRSENGTYYAGAFGTNGDLPAPGDFDLDGKADLVVFRPSTGVWYVFNSSNLSVSTIIFGQNGDVPVTADYDGDNRADAAVYRPSTGVWWLKRSTLGVIAFQFGNSTDKPAPGDYSGDGKADAAFFRPSNGNWFILRSENQTYYSGQFGINGDVPVPGDYDGDGKHDPALFRPSNSTWYVQRSTNINSPLIQTFGIAGDKPAPSAFVP